MNKPEFQVQLSGESVVPEAVDIEDLVPLLTDFRKALFLTARGATAGPVENEPVLSLVGVEAGSARFRLAIPKAILPALLTVTEAIAAKDYSHIPPAAQDSLASISRQVVLRSWELNVAPGPGAPIRAVRIAEGAEVPVPAPGTLSGTTRVYGRLLRVGGVRPAVLLRVRDTDRAISIQATEELASELASHLYQDVGLECEVVWGREEWTMNEIRAVRVLPYQRTGLADAFRELANAAAGRWDAVDAEKYAKEMRSEDAEE